jgi:hypothetical protein
MLRATYAHWHHELERQVTRLNRRRVFCGAKPLLFQRLAGYFALDCARLRGKVG